MLDGGSIPPISTKRNFMIKEVKVVETSINPETFLKQTKIRTAYIDTEKDYEADFLAWKNKILSDGDDQVSTA